MSPSLNNLPGFDPLRKGVHVDHMHALQAVRILKRGNQAIIILMLKDGYRVWNNGEVNFIEAVCLIVFEIGI